MFLNLIICFFGSIFGTNLKSILTSASPGSTVFAPSPVYPETNLAILHVGSPTRAFLASSPFFPPTKELIPNSFLNTFASNGSLRISSKSFFVNGVTSLYQSLMRILPLESLSVFTASINLHAGFFIKTAKLECASIFDSFTDNSTNSNPFIPRPIIGLFFASTYPNSQITPSQENFFLYFFR